MFCSGKIIPLEVLIAAWKENQIEKLQQRANYLQNRIELYSQLNLSLDQKNELNELIKKNAL